MATFTITTSVNIDELVGKGGGDTYNINAGTLVIDQDSRYGLNASTSAILGTITVYDDDNTTPLLAAELFEDAGGTQAYRGKGADRRDRLV